jgi:hypothetical protein
LGARQSARRVVALLEFRRRTGIGTLCLAAASRCAYSDVDCAARAELSLSALRIVRGARVFRTRWRDGSVRH